jgi:HEAT repeat protein
MIARGDVDGLIAALNYSTERSVSPKENYETVRVEEVGPVVHGAALGLAQIGDPRAIKPLLACIEENGYSLFLTDDTSPTALAPTVLSSFGANAIEPLLDVLDGSFPRMQEIAAFAVGRIGDSRAIPALIERSSPAAIWALGQIGGGTDVIDALLVALESESHDVRTPAMHALGSRRFGPVATERLAELAAANASDEHHLAEMALCELGDPRGMEALLARWYPEGRYARVNPLVSGKLLALGCFDDPRVGAFLQAAMNETEQLHGGVVGIMAACALAARGDADAAPKLVETVLNTGNLNVKHLHWSDNYAVLAAKALATLGDVGIEALSRAASDESRSQFERDAARATIDVVRSGQLGALGEPDLPGGISVRARALA